MTILLSDPLFQRHETGSHPERPARLAVIQSQLENAGLIVRCKKAPYEPLTPAEVCEIHTPEVVANARRLADAGGGWLEADTLLSAESYQVALAAAGAGCAGVE